MKALPLESNMQHLVLLEEGDRFISLTESETAVVLDEHENTGEVKVTVHFPKVEEDGQVPFSMMLAGAVREFLSDPEWVARAQERMKVKMDSAKNEENKA